MKKVQKRIVQIILLTLVGALTLSLIPQASWLAFRQLTLFSKYGNAAVNHAKKLTEQDVKPQPFLQPEIAFSDQGTQLEVEKKKSDDAEAAVERARQKGYSEVESKRTATSTTFDKGNGEEVVIVSSSEINYKDKDGKMVPVDTEIKEQNGKLQTNATENIFTTTKTLKEGISFGKQGEQFQLVPEKEATVKKIENNTITYATTGETASLITIDASNSGYTLQEMLKLKDTYETTYTLKTSLKPELSENKQSIMLTKDGKRIHTIGIPRVEDTQGHIPEITGGYQLEEKGNGQWKVSLRLKLTRLEGMVKGSMPGVQKFTTNEGFVANVSIPVMKTLPQGQVKMYGIRQVSDPSYSYGPAAEVIAAGGKAGGPEDRMIVGQDDTGVITGLVNWSTRSNKALIRFDLQGQSWKDYVGGDQELVSANLKMNVRTHNTIIPAAKTGVLTTVNRITTDYGNPARTSWNSFYGQNVGQEAVSEVLVKRLETGLTEFASFDIQNAVQAWMAGQPDYGLILGTDAGRGTYVQFYMNHLASNGASRPYLELTTKKRAPVPLDLPLDQTTLKARAFATSDNNGTLLFQALGFDGVVRPGATVDYRIVEENDKSKVIVEGNAVGAGADRVFPYYTKEYYPLQPKWQNYYKLESNWQGVQMVAADKFQKNKLYRIQYKTKAVIDNKEQSTEWKDNDTFQTYSVRSFDRLPRLLSYYGVEDNTVGFRIDNHLYDYLLMEKNEIFIRNPKKNGGSAYSPAPLSDEDKRRIDGSLMGRGKHCKFGFEPITMNTGNWFYSTRDIEFYEYGEQLAFERNYNSLAGGIDSMIGRNWSFAPFAELGLYNSKAEIKLGDGNILTFDQKSDGTYQAPQSTYETLTRIQVGESTFTEDNNYYDTEAAPIQGETKLPKYQFIMKTPDEKTYTFNGNGTLAKYTYDRYGHTLTFEYDENENVKTITTSSGKTFTFTYTGGYVTQITTPDDQHISYTYSEKGDLITATDQMGLKTVYTYDENHHITALSTRVAEGNPTPLVKNEYDENGRVTKQSDDKGNTTSLSYSDTKTVAHDAKGQVTTYELDDQKRITTIIKPDGTREQFHFDNKGNETTQTKNNTTTENTYDANGNITKKVTVHGIEIFTYNERNQILSHADVSGNTTAYRYDQNGNQTEIVYPDGSRETFTYNNDGQQTTHHKNGTMLQSMTYDKGNKVSQTDEFGNTTTYQYDALSYITVQTDASGHAVSFIRNRRGELTAINTEKGSTSYTYDYNGNTTSMTDPNGNVTTYTYDGWARLLTQTDALGTKRFEYDANGNKIALIDEDGNTTRYSYDQQDRMKRQTEADGYTLTYQYDDKGNLTSVEDNTGVKSTYTYNQKNQLITITNPLGKSKQIEYDVKGNITKITVENGEVTRLTYDVMDRNVSITDSYGNVQKVAYDINGNKKETTQNGRNTTYQFTTSGLETKMTDAKNNTTSKTYTKDQLLASYTTPLGATYQFGYDAHHNITTETNPNGNTTTKTYDGNDNLIQEKTAEGSTTVYTYGPRNLLTQKKDPNGSIWQYHYNKRGKLIEMIDPYGFKTTYTYNNRNQLTSTTDPKGNKTDYTYDKRGNRIQETDALGQVTTYTYNVLNQMIEQHEPTGVKTTIEYDEIGRKTKQSNNLNQVTTYTYEKGRLTKETDQNHLSNTYHYNEAGDLAEVVDVRGNKTTYTYDLLGQLIQKVAPTGLKTTYTHDADGRVTLQQEGSKKETYTYDKASNLLTQTNALNEKETHTYDKDNRPVQVTYANGTETKTVYDSMSLPIEVINQNGASQKMTYDAYGRSLSKTTAEGNTTGYQYDPNGNLVKEVDSLKFEKAYKYDALNRKIGEINQLGGETTYTYNVWNMPEKITDGIGNQAIIQYNEKGLPTLSKDPNGNETRYTYDKNNQLIETRDPNGRKTTNEYNQYNDKTKSYTQEHMIEENQYDQYGRLIERKDANQKVTTYTYNEQNQIIKQGLANGNQFTYAYDVLGRVTEIKDLRNQVTKRDYDKVGNITTLQTPKQGKLTYEYDKANNVTKTTNQLNQSTSYNYDKDNRQTAITSHLKTVKKIEYDSRNQVTKEIDENKHETAYRYNGLGQVTEVRDGRGNTIQNEYNKIGQLTQVKDKLGNITSYQYDKNGNQTQTIDAQGNTTKYSYDKMNNLTKVEGADSKTENFTYDLDNNQTKASRGNENLITKYDGLANVITKDTGDNQYTYTYDNLNQVTQVKSSTGTATYTYDNAGSLTAYTDNQGQKVTYEYNEKGQKTAIIYPDNSRVTYTYNEIGQMTESKDKIDTTTYQYDGNGRLIEEKNTHETTTYTYDGANNLLSRNTTRDGSIVAKFEYTYNEVNDVVTESITLDTITTTKTYVYDKNRQLTHTKEKTKEHETEYIYTYDNLGNKTSTIKTVDGKREETQYTLQNGQVVGISGSENTKITRDKAGNVSQKTSSDGKVETFTYNSEGKLIGLTDNTGKSVVYTYDGFGNRTDKITTTKLQSDQDIRIKTVHNNLANKAYSGKLDKAQTKEKLETLKETLEAKVVAGITTCPTKVEGESKTVDQNHFINDINREHTEVLQVQNNKNEAIQTLIYGAAGKQKLLYNQSDIAYNLVKDAKQSVYGFTSGNQTASNLTKEVFAQDSDKENDNHHVALKQDYAAYGQAKRSMLEETPQFNGEMLSSGNLTYMRARNYDSTLGQFTSKDTWLGRQTNPLSQNRNTFVENNPVNYIDPSGHRVSGNGMYLCSDDGDRNCSIANNTQRIIYDSNAQVSYEDAQYRAVNRYANQPHIMNDWFQNNRPSSKYQKLQNLANYAQQATIAAEQKAQAKKQSEINELKNYLSQNGVGTSDKGNQTTDEYLEYLRKLKQVCDEQKAKAEERTSQISTMNSGFKMIIEDMLSQLVSIYLKKDFENILGGPLKAIIGINVIIAGVTFSLDVYSGENPTKAALNAGVSIAMSTIGYFMNEILFTKILPFMVSLGGPLIGGFLWGASALILNTILWYIQMKISDAISSLNI